jgi:GNAT superfamily N-acetyltransferase
VPVGPDVGPPTTPSADPSGPDVTEVLRDGSELRIRPIRATDGLAMTAFHQTLSPRSVYRRFFSSHPNLTVGDLERFTHVDYVDRMAFVVIDDVRIVGVGRYERLDTTDEAEVAFVVTDAYQHRGIAGRLLVHLAATARSHGIARFQAQTMSENRDMLRVFFSSGYPVTTTSDGGTVTVLFPIVPPAVPAATP